MPGCEGRFQVTELLSRLRQNCGDSEFGYRIQGFFAHVLIALGATIVEVNAQGHPDVRACLGDRKLFVQVKASKHGSPATRFELTDDDFRGISSEVGCEGVLAFLDTAPPMRWIVVPQQRACNLVGHAVHVATLQAEADVVLSEECTEAFVALVLNLEDRISDLSFGFLRRRALSRETL